MITIDRNNYPGSRINPHVIAAILGTLIAVLYLIYYATNN